MDHAGVVKILRQDQRSNQRKQNSCSKGSNSRGTKKHPYQLNLLTIASDVYRALGDRATSLKHAELLVAHHLDTWVGYGRSAEDLSALHRLEEAKEIIVSGLEKFPNQFNLLTIAI